jgi:hypothetical protein
MGNAAGKSVAAVEKKREISLAPGDQDALAFRQYTQRVWSKVAERPISEDEADQIIEDFGRFLRALDGPEGDGT